MWPILGTSQIAAKVGSDVTTRRFFRFDGRANRLAAVAMTSKPFVSSTTNDCPRFRQLYAASGPLEQGRPKLGFERADMAADRRVSDVELVSRARKTFEPRSGFEGFESVERRQFASHA